MSEIKELLEYLPRRTTKDISVRRLAKRILQETSNDDLEQLKLKSRLRSTEIWSDEIELRAFGKKIRRVYTMLNEHVYYDEKTVSFALDW
jgi:DNA repair protein RadC